jgi:hypothetical protein
VKPARLLLLLVFAACSRLPDFAAPKRIDSDSAEGVESDDLISYRRLERGDFKRIGAPGQVKHGKYELGALTCGSISTSPDTQLELVTTKEPDGQVRYTGTLKILRFRSLMDRKCSWWNPTNQQHDYTLQHEQIHFALHEIEARRLNEKAAKLVKTTKVEADDKDEVVERLNALIKELLDEHVEIALKRNHDFDSDTSLGHDPKRQQEWWNTVQRELAETAAYK